MRLVLVIIAYIMFPVIYVKIYLKGCGISFHLINIHLN